MLCNYLLIVRKGGFVGEILIYVNFDIYFFSDLNMLVNFLDYLKERK